MYAINRMGGQGGPAPVLPSVDALTEEVLAAEERLRSALLQSYSDRCVALRVEVSPPSPPASPFGSPLMAHQQRDRVLRFIISRGDEAHLYASIPDCAMDQGASQPQDTVPRTVLKVIEELLSHRVYVNSVSVCPSLPDSVMGTVLGHLPHLVSRDVAQRLSASFDTSKAQAERDSLSAQDVTASLVRYADTMGRYRSVEVDQNLLLEEFGLFRSGVRTTRHCQNDPIAYWGLCLHPRRALPPVALSLLCLARSGQAESNLQRRLTNDSPNTRE
ncbi:hypothetical protein KIPB_009784, partial [Kipferlia bialata]|eukprot:g9784.t1